MFYKDFIGEPMLNPIITYDKTKDSYPFEIFDLRFQVDHISSKEIGLFEEHDDDPANTIFYTILLKHREIKMIADRNKIISIEVIYKKILIFFKFYERIYYKKQYYGRK